MKVVLKSFLRKKFAVNNYFYFSKFFQDDEGEKSDQDLVVDVANEMVS